MNFFEAFQLFGTNVWLYGGSFVLILSILVFVHEFGHYIVAKWCGIKVEVFSIGFGKELLGFNDKSGTRWKVSLVPLGGYVKLFGDTDPASAKHTDNVQDAKTEKPRPMTAAEKNVAFFAKPVWKRALVVIAGPAINYLFALIVLALLFILNGQPVTPPSAAAVIQGSSAAKHGFLPHDVVISIDDVEMTSFEDIRREMMISLDKQKHFVVKRGEKIIDIYAKPEKMEQEDHFGFKHSRGLLGLISPRHAIAVKDIRKIGNTSFKEGEDDKIQAALARRMNTVFNIEVDRGPETDTLTVHPLKGFNENLGREGSPDMGLLFISDTAGNVFVKYQPHVAFMKALQECWVVTRGTLEALGQIITGSRSATELGGVIRIGAVAGDMAKEGIIAMILFTALLSINLGLINLFPIPLLDGGHLVFYSFEALLGRPIPDQIQEYAFRLGLAFLVGIMVFANLSDIMQLVL
jgi:regulator of sigma E protease